MNARYSFVSRALVSRNFHSPIACCVPSQKVQVLTTNHPGPRKQISLKNGGTNDLVEIHIYDDTATNKLCLWGILCNSGKEWIPNTTILLLTSPIFKFDARGNGWGNFSITNSTQIDLNPRFRDAEWLTKFSNNLYKRESLKQDFPKGVWDLEVEEAKMVRVVYTLKDIDEVYVWFYFSFY